jgi:hypothetical protein
MITKKSQKLDCLRISMITISSAFLSMPDWQINPINLSISIGFSSFTLAGENNLSGVSPRLPGRVSGRLNPALTAIEPVTRKWGARQIR